MIIIKNTRLVKIISFGFAKGLTIYPFILVKSDPDFITLNHERIHAEQQKELLIIPFYIIYLIEWIFKGYKSISFEIEADRYELTTKYYKTRRHYSFLKFM